MKKNILLWLLLGLANICFSQTVTIKEKETSKPLELVTIISESPHAFATTNTEGKSDISAFEGATKMVIRSLGYKTQVKSFEELKSMGFEVFMETSNFNLDEVVVSATKWSQTSDDIPSKIISISPKEVALQNPQTAADMLNISGQVYVQKSQQGGGSPMIRGFATNRLLYAVDGIRMNTAIFRGGNIQNVINIDPFAVEGAEVLFGPGSVIYGSDAIGGVMSFKTLTPHFSHEEKPLITGKALARYSSANKEKTGHFDVNIGLKKWSFVTSYSSWNFDHLRQGSNGPEDYIKPYFVQRQNEEDIVITQEDPLLQIPSAYSQYNLMQKVRFKPNTFWDLEYGFHYSETSPYGRYDRHNRVRNGTARYAEWKYGSQKWMMQNLNITNSQKTAIYDQVTLRLGIQSFEESRIDRSLNKDERTTNVENVEAYSANLDFKKSLSKKNTIFYGFEYVLNDVSSEGSVKDISTNDITLSASRYPNSTWGSFAAYVNEIVDISSKLSLQAGLRYAQFKLDADFSNNIDFYPLPFTTADISNGSLTGSIGGVYRPAESLVLSANFGTAFRSPNVDDIGKVFDSEPGAVTVPNPDLKAEYAYNFDLGVAKVFGDAVKLDLTGYYTVLQNALVRRNFQLNGQDSIMYFGELSQVQALQNAATANVYGIQAGIEVKFSGGFSFTSDINYQVGEEETDDGTKSPSRHAAPLFGVTRLNYTTKKLNLQFYASYQGEVKFEDLAISERSKDEIYAKDSNGNNYSPSWCTLNVKASYAIAESLTINAGMENLTDQRYRPYSSGISAPGRNFILSLQANF